MAEKKKVVGPEPFEEITVIERMPARRDFFSMAGIGSFLAGFTEVGKREAAEKSIRETGRATSGVLERGPYKGLTPAQARAEQMKLPKFKQRPPPKPVVAKSVVDKLLKLPPPSKFPLAIIEEITVVAKRPSTLGRLTGPIGSAAFLLADIGAKIAGEVSQRRLDEAGRKATRTVPPRPDTPVRTIRPEVIPEIIVTAKLPPKPVMTAERIFDDFTDVPLEPRRFVGFVDFSRTPKRPVITAPSVEAKKKTKPKSPAVILGLVGDIADVTRPRFANIIPRSGLLRIGAGTGQLPDPIGASLVGGGTLPASGAGFGFATGQAVALASAGCPPCPRPKKKRRAKCYRQLVKQGRYAASDKISKWAEINCETGRTIKELI